MDDKDRAVLALSYLQGYLDEAVRIARHRKDWECYTDMDNAVNEAVYRELAAVRDALYAIYLDDDDDKTPAWFLSEVQNNRDKCRIKAWTNESEAAQKLALRIANHILKNK